ncbi:MAG: cation:proton antiporter [Pelomonas sp.]|nr:cation:proton antiporter [Roseateles sp.]
MIDSIVRLLQIDPWPPQPGLLFWLALTLVGAALLGGAVHRLLGLPRVLGYGAVGMGFASLGFGSTDAVLSGTDRLVIDLAMGLLMFELGSRVSLRWLRVNNALLVASAAESLLGFGAAFAVLRHAGLDFDVALAGTPVLGASAGALIGRVAAETRANGQVTERMIVLGALNTLYAVLLSRLMIGGLYVGRQDDWAQGIVLPLYAFGGAAALAVLLSLLVGWVLRRFDLRDENSVLLLLGLLLLTITLARALNLSTLLVPLLAGVCLRNLSERPCIWPRHFGTAGAAPVLMLFVLIGASWSSAALHAAGWTAALVLLGRLVAKGVALLGLAHLSGIDARQGVALTLTQTPVAATTLVLLADLQTTHPQVAAQLAPIALAALAMMALLGPVLVHLGLRLAKELK